MKLNDLIEYAKTHEDSFNDIWFYGTDEDRQPLETEPVETLIGKKVPGLQSFGRHGDGSLFALWGDRICWLDSEGDQFVIARDVDHFADLLMFWIRDVWQAAGACQESDKFVADMRDGKHRTLESLVEDFAWLDTSPDELRKMAQYKDGAGEYAAWATKHGRAAPKDLVARLVELRSATAELRKLCS